MIELCEVCGDKVILINLGNRPYLKTIVTHPDRAFSEWSLCNIIEAFKETSLGIAAASSIEGSYLQELLDNGYDRSDDGARHEDSAYLHDLRLCSVLMNWDTANHRLGPCQLQELRDALHSKNE